MKKLLSILTILIFVCACSDQEQNNNPAQAQIDEYTSTVSKQAEDCEDTDEQHAEAKKEKIAERGFSIEKDDIVIGDPDSKIIVIEYFAMTCPHCYGFLKRTYPEIKSKYIDTKKVAYVFREFVGNKQDLYASTLARCKGDTESFIKFMEVLLSKQDNWAFTKKFEEVLTNIASLGGVSPEEYSACIANDKFSEMFIENTKVPLRVPGFIGTPTFFINGEHFTKPYTFKELSKAIDEAIEKVRSE